jgi:uncharacterized protein YciW
MVLIAHEGCAYYTRRLALPPETIEAAQQADLHKATETVQRLAPLVSVKRYMARRAGAGVAFELL